MDQVLFSIVIPIFNSAQFINDCVNSVLLQTYQKYEIIIINDGSCDGSFSVCEQIAAKHEKISFCSIPHQGAGAARNEGVRKAQGDYILFLDADDYWIDDALLQKLADLISGHPTDLIMFQMVKVTEDGKVLSRYKKPIFKNADKVWGVNDVYLSLVRDGQVLASACNKCIRLEILREKQIEFPTGCFAEDVDWVIRLFSYVGTVRLQNLEAYAYRQHKTVSASREEQAPNDLVFIIKRWIEKVELGIVPNKTAVLGLVAFEYGICMGYNQFLDAKAKKIMLENQHLLKYGQDRKTKSVYLFHHLLGYDLTCLAIRFYLFLRRLW